MDMMTVVLRLTSGISAALMASAIALALSILAITVAVFKRDK